MWETDDVLFDRLEAVAALAEECGTSMAQFSLASALAQPAMSSMVVGAKRLQQIEEAVQAADLALSAETLARVDQCCPPPWPQPAPLRS